MKKKWTGALALCAALVLSYCGAVQDPADALKATLAGFAHEDGLAPIIAQAKEQDALLARYPLLEEKYTAALKAYYSNVGYEIADSKVDEEAETAVVTVDVNEPDAAAVSAALDDWQREYIAAQAKNGGIDEEAMYGAQLERLAELYADASLPRTVRRADVPMTYDAETKSWVITDISVLFAA